MTETRRLRALIEQFDQKWHIGTGPIHANAMKNDLVRLFAALLSEPQAAQNTVMTQPMSCRSCGWEGPYRAIVQAGLHHELCPKCEEAVYPVEGYPFTGVLPALPEGKKP